MYPRYRQVIFDKLKRTAGLKDLDSAIEVERYLTPQDIHERYGVLNGAIYGIASHGRLQGGFKPANHDPKCVDFIWPAARRIPAPVCQWC